MAELSIFLSAEVFFSNLEEFVFQMAIAQSILKTLMSVFFGNISVFVVEKNSIIKNAGHRQSWVAIFWSDLSLRGQIGVHPPKKINFRPNFSQRIDRKSKKMSVPLAWPFGNDKCSKKVWVNLTPPLRAERVKCFFFLFRKGILWIYIFYFIGHCQIWHANSREDYVFN